MSGRGYIAKRSDARCEQCKELRPYGSYGENICFDCAMKDEDTAKKRFRQHVFGEGFDA